MFSIQFIVLWGERVVKTLNFLRSRVRVMRRWWWKKCYLAIDKKHLPKTIRGTIVATGNFRRIENGFCKQEIFSFKLRKTEYFNIKSMEMKKLFVWINFIIGKQDNLIIPEITYSIFFIDINIAIFFIYKQNRLYLRSDGIFYFDTIEWIINNIFDFIEECKV